MKTKEQMSNEERGAKELRSKECENKMKKKSSNLYYITI